MTDRVRTRKPLRRIEEWAAVASLLLLGFLPIVEAVIRLVARGGIPGYNGYLFHLVVAAAFLGGMITAREGRHLAIRVAVDALPERARTIVDTVTAFLAATITTAFFWAAVSFTAVSFVPGTRVGIVPIQVFAAVIPLGFLVMGIRFLFRPPAKGPYRLIAALGIILGTVIGYSAIANIVYTYALEVPLWIDTLSNAWYSIMAAISVPLIIVLIVAAFAGVPLFVVLGGVALLLFARDAGAIEVIANEGYVMLTGNTIPAIPLFTLAGYFLSESRAGERLMRLFRALFGWLPGGLVIAAVLVSTFFTTFTGASGVTILALGGLLLYILVQSGNHSEGFSTGILTASGSIGLLFPPSLAIIVYGSVAQVSIFDLFLGGILPGVIMVLAMSAFGVVVALKTRVKPVPFKGKDVLAALRESIWEILLPVIIILVYFLGIATLVETAAIAVVYTLIVEMVIHREISLRDLSGVVLKALSIIGAVLVILALARGLSYYIIDVQIPVMLTRWVERAIGARFVFLLLVNLALLIAGMFMDIFSAILVIAPLIIPLGEVFGIHPVHLGIIFIANMGIGFITPPVGLNLFFASLRFNTPLSKLYRHIVPFFFVQLVVVLVITYVPWLSTAFLGR
jgi:tripartite ATP-independent transporter DctM subunit